ncbi:hypothetical protein DICVIV_05513 [Dictyocaulus viviparus]|uniref:Zinc finger, C2H2 type n=1 Tax=Dictyocaulus viviparus TaxID=29172 RepID=A0A0D8XUW4_DICVI|nr:hypothetical protein DICVIV_05513 [Dictyocaulus viviparus]
MDVPDFYYATQNIEPPAKVRRPSSVGGFSKLTDSPDPDNTSWNSGSPNNITTPKEIPHVVDTSVNEVVNHDGIRDDLEHMSPASASLSKSGVNTNSHCTTGGSQNEQGLCQEPTERTLLRKPSSPLTGNVNKDSTNDEIMLKTATPAINVSVIQDGSKEYVTTSATDTQNTNLPVRHELINDLANRTTPLPPQTNTLLGLTSDVSHNAKNIDTNVSAANVIAERSFLPFSQNVPKGLKCLNAPFGANEVGENIDQRCQDNYSPYTMEDVLPPNESQSSGNTAVVNVETQPEFSVNRATEADQQPVDNKVDGSQNNVTSSKSVFEETSKKYLIRPKCAQPMSTLSMNALNEPNKELVMPWRKPLLKTANRLQLFHCHIPGCGKSICWRPRYGKSRLVDHVRIHFGKAVKKCKLCDFKAISNRKINHHHKSAHSGDPYRGALSLESLKDANDILLLWEQCFPGRVML